LGYFSLDQLLFRYGNLKKATFPIYIGLFRTNQQPDFIGFSLLKASGIKDDLIKQIDDWFYNCGPDTKKFPVIHLRIYNIFLILGLSSITNIKLA
jgi:hypothetical protein